MTIPLSPQADEAWTLIRRTLASMKSNFSTVKAKIQNDTCTGSDVIDALYNGSIGYEESIDAVVAGVSGATTIQSFVRSISGNASLPLNSDYQALKTAWAALRTAIDADTDVIVNDESAAGHVIKVSGKYRTRTFTTEVDALVPLIDDCLALVS